MAMSRYEIRTTSGQTQYKLVLGFDSMLGTFYVQVYKKGTPRPVLWLGSAEIIADIEEFRAALAPYGGIDLSVCADLLRDQAIDQGLQLPTALSALVALSRSKPGEAAPQQELDETLTYYLLIDQSGCHVRDWASLPADPAARDETLRRMIYGSQDPLASRLEMVTGYFTSTSLLLLVDEYGVRKRLPLYIALPRRGEAYPGPVGPLVITYLDAGMSVYDVRRILEEELFVLDPAVQAQATDLYYRSPLSRLSVF
jgi:hypothetical protein